MPDRVEVLLATYNSADYLAPMLDSLLDQTYDDFHLVISDDGSRDETLAILEAFAPRFRHPVTVRRQPVPSGSASANFGSMLAQTRANYVLLADHDDVWLPKRIAAGLDQVKAVEAELGRATPVLAHSDLQVIDGAGRLRHESYWAFKQIVPSAGARLPSALMHATVTGCTITLNRALIDCSGRIPTHAIMHDWWLNLVAAAFGRVVWDPEARIGYRIHGGNASRPRRVSLSAVPVQLDRLRGMRRNIRRRFDQGRAFRDTYGDALPAAARAQLDAFVRLQTRAPLLRQVALVQGGFLWPGVWRNVVQLPFA